MSGLQPVAVYAAKVPPGDILVPAVPDFAATFRLTMAAIDPSAEPELEDANDKRPARATLKVIRVPDHLFNDDSDESDDEDYLDGLDDDSEDSEDDEEANGGPSERKSKKQALLEALAADEEEDEEMDDDEDDEDDADDADADEKAVAVLKKLLKDSKGKGKALDGESDSEEDEDDEAVEMDEVVICTLDAEKNFQQTLDFVVGEGEKVFFKVSGTHTVHLTGNYVIPTDDGPQSSFYDDDEDDSEEDYDLSPDEDELAELEGLSDDESDELDDIDDPRLTEIASDEEEEEAPKPTKGKGKNKRPAADSEDEEEANLDDIIAKSQLKTETAAEAANSDSKKLSKAEKKRQKKLKKNDGEAAAVEPSTDAATGKKDANGIEKKVQFAKNLEQGPTPSAAPATATTKAEKGNEKASSTSIGITEVQGVTIDNRKVGTGPAAKKGNRIEMRYIGKLDNGKVFDSNKSGKPFTFKLGAGEVIKGWDVGVAGIQVGGERRLIIPAALAYGNKALPGIPKGSRLTFDIKCLGVK